MITSSKNKMPVRKHLVSRNRLHVAKTIVPSANGSSVKKRPETSFSLNMGSRLPVVMSQSKMIGLSSKSN